MKIHWDNSLYIHTNRHDKTSNENKKIEQLYENFLKMKSIYVPGLDCLGVFESDLLNAYILYNTDKFTDIKVYKELDDILYDINYTKQFKILKALTKNKVL
jgi:hypothetical protein